ncbi:MAG: 2-amino-4-hydroxy-6-hydroxymethyldihydropteridine diphosphokinase [bacterium]|nr:2-amino-4-hydroxy-6-hydroxymethyldihydropteridine diphosphokinase [bacterium]
MANCLVSFGANIGNPALTVAEACDAFREVLDKPDTLRRSRLFKTPPVGGPVGQPPFVNAVAAFETSLSEWQIWELVRKIEHQFGRQRNIRWEARKLDLDILLYDAHRVWTPHLKIPHPRMCMRRFILQPACDVAAEWLEPVSRQSLAQLAARLQARPASICLVAKFDIGAQRIAGEVARLARADWNPLPAPQGEACPAPANRWLQLQLQSHEPCGEAAFAAAREIEAGLIVYLASPVTDSNVAWEDQHRVLASRLNLRDDPQYPAWNVSGPRYLLESDDPDWATHELVAALDAMDCPVEAIC